jgi:hypothetical protein
MPTTDWNDLIAGVAASLATEHEQLLALEKERAADAENRVRLARSASRTQRVGATGRAAASTSHQAEQDRAATLRTGFSATRDALTKASADIADLVSQRSKNE